MKKKKESSILLPADKYWSDKLDIDFEVELARYRFLCGSMLEEGNQSLNGHYYTTYMDWKSYIEEKISHLNDSETTELYHYLKNEKRRASIRTGMSANIIFPILASVSLPTFFEAIKTTFDNTQNSNFVIGIIELILILVFFHLMIKPVITTTKDYKVTEYRRYFYSDLKEIVEAHMKGNK